MTNRLLAALCLLALPVLAGPLDSLPPRGSDADRASKSGQLAGEVGGAKYVVTYGRPKVKARKVWGGLVEGQKLPAGAYAFFTIPGKDPTKDPWTVIFNKQPKQWGAFKYDEKGDALKVKVTPKNADMVDELTYEQQGGAIVLRWEKLAVPVNIKKAQ